MRKDALNRHMACHNVDRQYRCEFCDKSFISVVWFKGHLSKMHGIDSKDEKGHETNGECVTTQSANGNHDDGLDTTENHGKNLDIGIKQEKD